eukprot:344136_1
MTASSDCTDPSIGNDDTCILHCDKSRQKNLVFDCGNAGQCIFQCEEKKCMEQGTLNAQNAHNLTVVSSGHECLKGATVNAPNHGNAMFSMQDQKSFKEMTVNSGTNTQSIFIDCTYGVGDDGRDITINAATAQYLEVKIGSNSELQGNNARVMIYCPQNSSYNGPQRSSCIIDLSEGGTLSYTTIHTLYGIPNDVWIHTGPVTLSQVQITCVDEGMSHNLGNSFVKQGDCWNTAHTTSNPTYNPTTAPTSQPTTTQTTTNTQRIIMDTKDDMVLYNVDANLNTNNGDIWTSDTFLFCVIGIALAICFLVVGVCFRRRSRRRGHRHKKHVIHYKLKSNSSNHMVSVDVGAIIMRPGHSVLPVLSPNNSQDDDDVTEEEDFDGMDPLELVEEGVETTRNYSDEEYYEDEIETDESEDGDRSRNTVSLDESC